MSHAGPARSRPAGGGSSTVMGRIVVIPHAGSGSARDRWFGFIRNIVFTANVTAIAHFASLQYWAIHRYGARFDLYSGGEIGAAWSAFQLLLIATLAFGNWIVAERDGQRLSLFWLISAGGFL